MEKLYLLLNKLLKSKKKEKLFIRKEIFVVFGLRSFFTISYVLRFKIGPFYNVSLIFSTLFQVVCRSRKSIHRTWSAVSSGRHSLPNESSLKLDSQPTL